MLHAQVIVKQVPEQRPALAGHGVNRHAPDLLEYTNVRTEGVHLVQLQPLAGEVVYKSLSLCVLQYASHLFLGILAKATALGGGQQSGIRHGVPQEVGQPVGQLYIGKLRRLSLVDKMR